MLGGSHAYSTTRPSFRNIWDHETLLDSLRCRRADMLRVFAWHNDSWKDGQSIYDEAIAWKGNRTHRKGRWCRCPEKVTIRRYSSTYILCERRKGRRTNRCWYSRSWFFFSLAGNMLVESLSSIRDSTALSVVVHWCAQHDRMVRANIATNFSLENEIDNVIWFCS